MATRIVGSRKPPKHKNHSGLAVRVLIVFICALVYARAASGASASASPQVLDTSGQDYYRNAYTLVDLSPKDIVNALPELLGLVPASDQQALPRLLAEMGENIENSYRQFKQIIADESVTQVQCSSGGHPTTTFHREFTYLILPKNEEGRERIEEYRAGVDGRPVQEGETSASIAQGFAGIWTLFYPGNQSGSRFRYFGRQRFGDRTANIIGFAQKPGWSTVIGLVNVGSGGRRVSALYQGVAWVDTSTNKLLKVRTDLLKPRLDVQLELQTTEINFGEVHLPDKASTSLWVPLRMTITTVWSGDTLNEEHLYSNYRLPGSTSIVLPIPEKTSPPPRPN